MSKLFKYWHLFLLVLLCLTPILWFWGKGDVVLNGVDTNFPLDPLVWFQRRFFVWNNTINSGIDFSSSVAGLFFHLVQVIPYKLGFALQNVQLISLIFWFSAVVFSSYILARTIFPKNKFIQILFVTFYCFNPYLFNTWENAKVANLSLVAAIPASIALLISAVEKRISKKATYFYAALIGLILAGGGINPSYFITFFMVMILFLFARVIVQLNLSTLKNSFRAFLHISIVIILVNLFWMIPTANFIFKNISSTGSIEQIGFTNWVGSLSENTSLLNVMRVQGAWDWYAFDSITGLPLYIPYALTYFYNPIFILFSFLILSLAIIAFVIKSDKKRELYIFFGLILVLGVFFGTGAHAPTGSFFIFLAEHIPFFSLFRSPWYVFTPLVTLSLAGLMSLLFVSLSDKSEKLESPFMRSLVPFTLVVLIFGNLIYNYPLITGKIFRPGRADSFYVHFPSYILQAKDSLPGSGQGRIIGYPDDELERFNWGYIGIESILSLFSNEEVLFSSLNNSNSPSSLLIRGFYQSLKKNQIDSVLSFAARLNIKSLLYKKDQESLSPSLPNYFNQLPQQNFGEWKFYSFPKDKILPKIYTANSFMYAYPIPSATALTLTPINKIMVNPYDGMVGKIPEINQLAGSIISAENSQTKSYNNFRFDKSKLANRLLSRDLSSVDFTLEVPKDGDYKPVLERYHLEDFGLDLKKDIEMDIDQKKTLLKVESMNDSFVFFAPVSFTQGKHTLSLKLQNKNVTFGGDFNEGYVFKRGGQGKGEGKYLIEENGAEKNLSILNIGKPDISADFPVAFFDYMSAYYIEFKYRQIYGNNGSVFATQFNDKGFLKVQLERLPNYPEWQIFSLYYDPVMSPSNLRIELVAPFTADPLGTKILYDDLKVQRVFLNDLFLVDNSGNSDLSSGQTDFKKVSPVLYEGEVKNSSNKQILVFLENFSPEWELTIYDENNKKITRDFPHFSANYYANAWYLDEVPQNYKYKIYYKSQDLFKLGFFISSVTLVITAILFVKAIINSRKGT